MPIGTPFQLVPRTDSGASTGTDTLPPSDAEILDCLVENNGIVMRVAAKLEIEEADIYRVVTRCARQLSTKLRAALMLRSFTTMIKVSETLEANLVDMSPDAAGRTYAATLAAFSGLAGQFEENNSEIEEDDASAAKQFMLDHIEKMKEREQSSASVTTSASVGEEAG